MIVDITPIIEAATGKSFKFINSETRVDSKRVSDEELSKIIIAVNTSWGTISGKIKEYVRSLLDEWYEDDGEYMYGCNTVAKVMKFAVLDVVDIYKRSNNYAVEIWYNSKYNRKDADKFFGNHSLVCNVELTKDFKVSDIDCQLEG